MTTGGTPATAGVTTPSGSGGQQTPVEKEAAAQPAPIYCKTTDNAQRWDAKFDKSKNRWYMDDSKSAMAASGKAITCHVSSAPGNGTLEVAGGPFYLLNSQMWNTNAWNAGATNSGVAFQVGYRDPNSKNLQPASPASPPAGSVNPSASAQPAPVYCKTTDNAQRWDAKFDKSKNRWYMDDSKSAMTASGKEIRCYVTNSPSAGTVEAAQGGGHLAQGGNWESPNIFPAGATNSGIAFQG